jgi:hypothetical protein
LSRGGGALDRAREMSGAFPGDAAHMWDVLHHWKGKHEATGKIRRLALDTKEGQLFKSGAVR